ncbi:hypothetical protein LguiB_019648 [Lonicera macranthoides]
MLTLLTLFRRWNTHQLCNSDDENPSVECYACTQAGFPVFHSTSCDRAHQPQWEASAGTSLVPIHYKHTRQTPNTRSGTSTGGPFGSVLDPRSKHVQRWNRAFVLARGMAMAVDPLFFYVLSIGRGGSPCLYFNAQLAVIVTVLRTCLDAVHLCHMCLQFRLAFVSRESLVVGCGKLVWDARAISSHYVRSVKGFWFDAFVILPIPQVVILLVVPRLMKEEEVTLIMSILELIFLFQFLPKVLGGCCTFGNNLDPTSHWLEVIFIICTVLSGLMLFTLLIGNIQVFLLAVMAKKRKMQLRCRDMEWWMKRRQLPSQLRQRVRHYERHQWAAMGGQDEIELIKDLPEGLRRDIKRFLCLDLIKKVPLFHSLDDDLILDNICDRVKPLVFASNEKREAKEDNEVLLVVLEDLGSYKYTVSLAALYGIQQHSDPRRNSHSENSIADTEPIECYACTQVGIPVFHSTTCDSAHPPKWEALAGSSLFPTKTAMTRSTSDPFSLFARVLDPRSQSVQCWNRVILLTRGQALAVDPLFFFAMSINISGRNKACIHMGIDVAAMVSALRTCLDAVQLCHVWLQFRFGYVPRESFGGGVRETGVGRTCDRHTLRQVSQGFLV